MHSLHALLSKQKVELSFSAVFKTLEVFETGGSWKKSPERIYLGK
jgi:hypothetical protein